MDPQACLEELLKNLVALRIAQDDANAAPDDLGFEEVVDGLRDETVEGLTNLRDWIGRKGYAPCPYEAVEGM